jgi:hypothetical protein
MTWIWIAATAATTLFLAMVLVAISVPMAGLVATGTVHSPLRTAMYAMFLAACVLGFVSLAYKVVEWIDRYRTLVRDDVKVPRRGFSWWLIGAWVLSMIMVLALGTIPANVQNSASELALLVPALFATLGMFPIAVVTALFVRRVNTHFERHKTVDSPESYMACVDCAFNASYARRSLTAARYSTEPSILPDGVAADAASERSTGSQRPLRHPTVAASGRVPPL